MESLKQVSTGSTFQQALRSTNQLALYDQYGSMAYGIILRIIPEPELAQAVLIDLFMSPQLTFRTEVPTAGEIIRLARIKALSAKPITASPMLVVTPLPATNDTTNTAKLVFTLSFCQGYGLDAIAEKLNLSPVNVLKAFYTYFKHLRSS